jgi:glycosyltransferase involved in cell wall biosynthesis
MKVILVSKRFNPGHISHMEANAKLLEGNGFAVWFSVNRKFLSFPDCSMKGKETRLWNWLTLRKGDLVVVWYSSISVVFNLLLVRLFTRATTVYVFHEPYTSFSSYRTAGFSWLKTVRVTAISMVSHLICALSDKIILPSTRALQAIPAAQHQPGRYAKVNLMFADESGPETQSLARDFVSYIGTIAEDHAFDEFVRLMQACIAERAVVPLRFLIATRSEVPEKHRAVIDQCVSSGRLVIQSGNPMTNGQINRFYAKSFVIWNAYTRSMQSGVLPKAYMFGTPVLVSTNNQSEYFEEGVHGVLISDQYTMQEFQLAITWLQKEWPAVSQNCRAHYLRNFDYRALSSTFMNFVSNKT